MSLNFNNIIIGGTSGGGGQTINNQDITVTQNGEYTAESGYTGLGTVTVNTPVINNQDITVTENGEYTAESGYTGLGTVTVEVQSGGGDFTNYPFTINDGTVTSGVNTTLYATDNHYYKANVTKVGSPAFSGSVVGNFSSSNYLKLPNPFNTSSNPWEINLKIKTSGDVTTNQCIIGNYGAAFQNSPQVSISTNFSLAIPTTSMSGAPIFSETGTYSVQPNTDYWLKISFSGSEYTLDYSFDGITYVNDITYTSSATMGTPSQSFLIGYNYWTSNSTEYFYGSIDLMGCSIKINGVEWWNGITSGTAQNYDYAGFTSLTCDPCTLTTARGEIIQIEDTVNVEAQNYKDGFYYVLRNVTNGELFLTPKLSVTKTQPQNPVNNDTWLDVSTFLPNFYLYDEQNTDWAVSNELVSVGSCEILNGFVKSVYNRTFNAEIEASLGTYTVKVIDYDGKILKLDYLNSGETFTLPDIPAHDGLIFQEWSSTKPIVNNTVTVTDNHILIGAVYDTVSGMSEFDIQINGGQNISLAMSGTKDWGDGTFNTSSSHTYSTTGNYTIKCNGTINSSISDNIVGTEYTPQVDYIKAVRLSSNITTIPRLTFNKCSSIAYITIPKGVTTIGNTSSMSGGAFSGAKHLTHLILPSTVATLQGSSFVSECSALKTFVSSAITDIRGSNFYYCRALNELVLPDTITNIEQYAFYYCTGLTGTVVMPSSLTSIGQYAFYGNSAIDIYDFSNCTSVPTLDNTNAFSLQQSDKIYVPADLLDEWKAASNWSSISGYITVKP